MNTEIITSELSRIADEEIVRSIEKHGPLNSRHEAYAVILEEFEEAEADMEIVKDALNCFWHCTKNDIAFGGEPETIVTRALCAASEMIQVAAVARKFIQQNTMATEQQDAFLENKWRELAFIPFVEADSPSGMILADSWFVFPKGVDREDILQYFDEQHSKGIEHLTGRLE